MTTSLREIWDYRDMIGSLVKRELRGKYEKSVLGFLWAYLGPLFQILIYSIVFTVVFRNDLPHYYIYLMVGMFPWNFFSDSVCQGTGVIVGNAEMIKKIYFPREVLVIAEVTAKMINMLLSFIVMAIFILISGTGFSIHLVALPMVVVIEYFWTLGIALIVSSLTVYLRDLEYVINVIIMAWVWGTPIMYTMDSINAPMYATLLRLNPMTYIINMYHAIFYYHRWFTTEDVVRSALCAVVAMIVGSLVFLKSKRRFAEEL